MPMHIHFKIHTHTHGQVFLEKFLYPFPPPQKNQRTVREANKKSFGQKVGKGFWGYRGAKGGFSGYGSGAASLNRAAKICVPQVASLVGRRRVTSAPNCSLLEALRFPLASRNTPLISRPKPPF